MTQVNEANKHHVVVVGGGFGGLQCIKSLKSDSLRITLIDQRNHHLFQPLLYQAATTILSPGEIAWPLRQLFNNRPDVTTLMATVADVDTDKSVVALTDGTEISYDTLVLGTGARHSYFGNDSWEAHAPGLKTLEDATNIRRKILTAFETAETSSDPDDQKACLTFAIIGAGPTGVELAGIIAELSRRVLPKEFRRIDTRSARVLLVEAGDKVLSAYPEPLSEYAKNQLTKLGVEVLLGDAVTDIGPEGIALGDTKIPSRTVIWAAGVQASPAARWLGAEKDRAGRVLVQPNLSVPNHPNIFVIGDTASVTNSKGKPVPGIAPAAKQMGAYVAKVISGELRNKPHTKPFKYRHAGSMATLGRRAAIADMGDFRMKGAFAWWIWGIAHIYFLIGTRSRLAVAWSWLWSYATGQNSARIITHSENQNEKL
jgi:NADH dehydrogenase